jgi:hypothetical protein
MIVLFNMSFIKSWRGDGVLEYWSLAFPGINPSLHDSNTPSAVGVCPLWSGYPVFKSQIGNRKSSGVRIYDLRFAIHAFPSGALP